VAAGSSRRHFDPAHPADPWKQRQVEGKAMTDARPTPEPEIQFKLGVYRVLVGDTEELARERQKARGAALVAEFEDADDVTVLDWGDTRDEKPHELVELLVVLASSSAVQAAAGTGVT
jgi:hypothetical protein